MEETYLQIYIYVWIIWSCVLVDEISLKYVAASLIVGLLWPIGIPVAILTKLLK